MSTEHLRTFAVGDRKYEFEIIDKYSRAGKDLICLTVRISHAPTGTRWRGQVDIPSTAHQAIDVLLADWLALAFKHHVPSNLPEDFDIPQGVPQSEPIKHICAVRGTTFSPQ
jgi:hypothetical protein